MRNSTRNRLYLWTVAAIGFACTAGFVWLEFHLESRIRWPLLVACTVFWSWFIVSSIAKWWSLRGIEHDLARAGIEIPDEPRIPIRFADERTLVPSIIALILIAGVFVAYYMGWLEAIGL